MSPPPPEVADDTGLRHVVESSLARRGLFECALRRMGLTGGLLASVHRRVAILAAIAWLPLLLLSALGGRLLGVGGVVPFLFDIEVHVRFLVALPLLILAEAEVSRRILPLLQKFPERGLIPAEASARFESAVRSAMHLRCSPVAEALVLAFVYGVGILIVWRQYFALDAATWYATPSADGSKLTFAGVWYGFVSVPIVQFLLLRWYWRLLVWARFLWQVSRIDLDLAPGHPDRVGGLGFLASASYAYTMLAMAHGALAAGQLASRIFFAGATLPAFAYEICAVVIFVLCVILGPHLFFAPQLIAAKQAALGKFGTLANRYVREFDAKWLGHGAPVDERLVGTADIQSLADLGNSYEVVRTMHIAPITRQSVVALATATLIPISPLLLTMIPLGELMKKLLGLGF